MKGFDRFKSVRIAALAIFAGLGLAVSVAAAESKREKAIDFEDQVVEGMNRRPLDSLRQDADSGDPRKRVHLYKFRRGFAGESEVTIGEMRWTR